MKKYVKSNTDMDSVLMTIRFGYKMDRSEVDEFLSFNDYTWDDYGSEVDAYLDTAESKFNYGLGFYVSVFDDTLYSKTDLESLKLKIELGYEMSRWEVEQYLRLVGNLWDEFSSDIEAYIETAEANFNYGLGCYATLDDPALLPKEF